MVNSETKSPLIVGFIADLMFTTRVEKVAAHLGFRVAWIGQATDIAPDGLEAPPETLGEKLYGRNGLLLAKIVALQPALLLFDLGNEAIPWQEWMPMLKASPATKRMPIMAYGPHVDAERLKRAQMLGADVVVPRSRFSSAMPKLLQEHVRLQDYAALQATCAQPLSPLAAQGIALFNQGEFYKCHDDLEDAWRKDLTPGRVLYQAILQVGIAYCQIERGNFRGAVKMLLRVRQWLDPLPAICRGVNVGRLRDDATAVADHLQQLGPDNIAQFDKSMFRPIEVIGEETN